MYRYLTAIVLLIAFSAQTFQQGFIVLGYYTNIGSFAKKCENRFRPSLHCNGKCLMMKKLEEKENTEKQNPEKKLENKNETISSRSFFASVPVTAAQILIPFNSFYRISIPPGNSTPVFHPPALA